MAVNQAPWGWTGSTYHELLKAEIYLDYQDISNNRSRFYYRVWNDSNTSYGSIGNVTCTISSSGVTRASVTNKAIEATTGYYQIRNIMEGTFWITHNPDGTLPNQTFTISASRTSGNVKNASFVITIDNIPIIPRASECTFEPHELGEPFRVYTNRQSSSFVHNLIIYVNNTYIMTVTNVGAYVDITPTVNQKNAMYTAIPNDRNGYMQIKCETYLNGTKIGEKVTERYVWLDNDYCMPTFAGFDMAEVNPLIPPLTSKIVSGYSHIKITIPTNKKAIAKYGASIVRYEMNVGNQTRIVPYSENEINETFYNVVGGYINVVAVDSRNLRVGFAYDYSNVIIDNYTPPSFQNVNINRVDGIGEDVNVDLKIKVATVEWDIGSEDPNSRKNTLAGFKYRVREVGGSWSNYFDKLSTVRGLMTQDYSTGIITINNLSLPSDGANGKYTLGKEYEIEIEIRDGSYLISGLVATPFQTRTQLFKITDGKVLEAFYKDENGDYHRGYGGMPDPNFNHMFYGDVNIAGALQVNGEIYKDYSWKQVSWSGDGSVNGTITVNRDIRNKLVCFEFISTINDYHYAYCTFYSSGRNNYLITTMYGNVKQPVVASMTATTFQLRLDWANEIKLNRIFVFDK